MIEEPTKHYPDRIEIELHIDANSAARSTGFSIPLYRNGRNLWRQGVDTAGEIDIARSDAGMREAGFDEGPGLDSPCYADIFLTLTDD